MTTAEAPVIAYKLAKAAQAVGFSTEHLRRAIRSGQLPAKYVGGAYYVSADALRDWFDALNNA